MCECWGEDSYTYIDIDECVQFGADSNKNLNLVNLNGTRSDSGGSAGAKHLRGEEAGSRAAYLLVSLMGSGKGVPHLSAF